MNDLVIESKDTHSFINKFLMANQKSLDAQLLQCKKVLAVQKIFLEKYEEGQFKSTIYKRYIRDKFYISERTFWRYLDTNAKKEIKRLEKELNLVEMSKMVENTN